MVGVFQKALCLRGLNGLGSDEELLSLSMFRDYHMLATLGRVRSTKKKSAQFFATLLFEVALELSSL